MQKILVIFSVVIPILSYFTQPGLCAEPFSLKSPPHYEDLGKIKDEESQSFDLTLSLDIDEEKLDQDLSQIYDPKDVNYHRFISPQEFRARYSPQPEQRQRVLSFLKKNGFEVVKIHENGFLLSIRGKSHAIQRAFNAEMHHYRDEEGNQYYASTSMPMIPSDMPFKHVIGMHNFHHPHRSHRTAGQADTTQLKSGYTPVQLQTAYHLPSNSTAKGQCVALYELEGYDMQEVNEFASFYSLPVPKIRDILLDNATGVPGNDMEPIQDIDILLSLAPGLDQIIVYEGTQTEQSGINTYAQIANDNICKSVSTSWGDPEAQVGVEAMEAENKIFKQMAAQGQSIFAAAGDTGYLDGAATASVDDPASQPYVTGVGGTTLTLDKDSNVLSEVCWDDIPGHWATGGGISSQWPIPSWQIGLANSSNKSSTTKRNVPDVSFDANDSPGISVYFKGKWQISSGTSDGAPAWAAFTAMVNSARNKNHLGPLGLMNPALYSIGAGNHYSQDFRDITEGDNGLYPATVGYDNVSGLGSPNVANLLTDLSVWQPN